MCVGVMCECGRVREWGVLPFYILLPPNKFTHTPSHSYTTHILHPPTYLHTYAPAHTHTHMCTYTHTPTLTHTQTYVLRLDEILGVLVIAMLFIEAFLMVLAILTFGSKTWSGAEDSYSM
jgi:hypothetical protein